MRRCAALPPPSAAAAASCRRHSTQPAASLGVCPFCLRDRLIDVQAAAAAERRRRHDADTDTELDAASAADQIPPPLGEAASASSSLYYYYYPPPTSTTAAGSRRSGSTGSRRSAASASADHQNHHATTVNDSSLRFFNNKPTIPAAAPPDSSALRLYGDHNTDPRLLVCSCSCMQSDREHRISFHSGCPAAAAACECVKSGGAAAGTTSGDEYIDERYIYPISRRRSSSPARRPPAAAALAPYLQYSGAVLLDQAPFSPSFADRRAPPLPRHNVPAGSLASRSLQNHHSVKHSGADPPPRPSLGGLRYVFHAGGDVPATPPAVFHQHRRLSRATKSSKVKRKNKQRLSASSNCSNNNNNVKPPVAANLCPLLHHHHLPPIDDQFSLQFVGRQSVDDSLNPFHVHLPATFKSSTPAADSCHCSVSPTTAGDMGPAHSGSPHWLSSIFGRRKGRRSKSVTGFSSSTINYKAYVMQRAAAAAAAAAAAHANSAVPVAGARYSADAAAAGARNFEEEDHRFMSKFPSLFTTPNNVVTKEVMDQLNISPPAAVKKPAMATAVSDARLPLANVNSLLSSSSSCTTTMSNSHNKKLLDFLRVDTRDAHISKCGRIDHPQPPVTELDRQSGQQATGVDLHVGTINPPTNFYPEQKTKLPERSRSPVPYRPVVANNNDMTAAESCDGTQTQQGNQKGQPYYAAGSERILTHTGARDRRNICFSGIRREDQHVTFTESTTILPKTDVKSSLFVGKNADNIAAAPPPNASSSTNALSVQTALRSWGRSLNKKLFLGRRWSSSSSTRASTPTPTCTSSNSSAAAAAMAATAASRSLGKSDLAMHNIDERLVLHNSIDPSNKRSSRSDVVFNDRLAGGSTGGEDREAPPPKDQQQQQQQARQSSLLSMRDYSAFSFYFNQHGHLAQSRGGGNPVGGDAVNGGYGTYDDDSGILTTMSTPEQVVVVPSHDILFQSRHSVDGSSRRL